MKYHIVTFGCQVNHSDSERIASVLETMGYQKTLKIQEADLVVINACSVRQSATDRILGQKPKIKKTAQTILTGCLVAQDKKKLTSHFDFILNIQDLSQWPKIITNSTPAIQAKPSKLSCNYLKIQPNYQTWPIAYVPISSGCNNFCAYCCVPYTRGREVSRSASEIVREVKNLIQQNYKEIWLLGQNVNSYRFQNTNFPKLLEKINKLKGDFWIRFTSPHPKDFSDE
ncbi:MAG: radical SAM protein, partial [Candidatus Gribaldobacteria bacterium]|nr:radical SAM protein [Candidatus Gribaldobacteria bacterium]